MSEFLCLAVEVCFYGVLQRCLTSHLDHITSNAFLYSAIIQHIRHNTHNHVTRILFVSDNVIYLQTALQKGKFGSQSCHPKVKMPISNLYRAKAK